MGLVMVGTAAPALAATVVNFNFTGGTDGIVQETPTGGNIGNYLAPNGTGFRLGVPSNGANNFVTLFGGMTLPGDFAGATVTSATLSIKDIWGEAHDWANAKMYEMSPTAPAWATATGAGWNCCWGNNNGATFWFANHNTAGGGLDWSGATVGTNGAHNGDITQAFSTLLDTKEMIGPNLITFNVLAAAQDWANGSTNRGLALDLLDATLVGASGNGAYNYSVNGAVYTGAGLSITYTPAVPEPAIAGVLAVGILTMLRIRRRTA